MVELWLAWTRQGNDPKASKLFTWDLTPATVVGGPPGHGPHHSPPPVLLVGTAGLLDSMFPHVYLLPLD